MRKRFVLVFSIVMVLAMLPLSVYALEKSEEHGVSWSGSYNEPEINLVVGGTYDLFEDYEYLVFKDENGNEVSDIVSETKYGIKGKAPGTVRVYLYDYDSDKDAFAPVKFKGADGKRHSYITVHVRKTSLKSTTTKKVYAIRDDNFYMYGKNVYFNIPGVDKYSQVYVEEGRIEKYDADKHRIKVNVYYPGSNKYKINIDGKVFTFNAKLVPVNPDKENIIGYKGAKAQKLKVKSGLKSEKLPEVTYASMNKKIATVGKTSGKVRFKKLGSTYVKVKVGNKVVGKIMVEVTYKKQYKAVMNALKDNKAKLKYSQTKRMKKKYRDCSSFVSRCYYDKSLGRKLYTIGPKSARKWSLTAAGQAKWLNQKGKRVAYKAVSVDKLLPGDLVYYVTGYAGENKEYRHIDHAAMYIGGGMCMDVHGYRYYSKYDWSVKFIGRPLK